MLKQEKFGADAYLRVDKALMLAVDLAEPTAIAPVLRPVSIECSQQGCQSTSGPLAITHPSVTAGRVHFHSSRLRYCASARLCTLCRWRDPLPFELHHMCTHCRVLSFCGVFPAACSKIAQKNYSKIPLAC